MSLLKKKFYLIINSKKREKERRLNIGPIILVIMASVIILFLTEYFVYELNQMNAKNNNHYILKNIIKKVRPSAYADDTVTLAAPSNLQITNVSTVSLTLTWQASNNDTAVAGYNIYRDNIKIASTTSLTYTDTNLSASTTYAYNISAFDQAGNESSLATTTSTTTLAVHTYYMPDDCSNLHNCFTLMHGGDTLIIRDGTYTGEENYIYPWHYPPFGSSNNYTTIQAEHMGQVIIDGLGNKIPFTLNGNGMNPQPSYIKIEGFVFKNSNALEAGFLGHVNHIKVLKCGFVTRPAVGKRSLNSFGARESSYILTEDCYAWGDSFYHFSYYRTEKSIMRRCVVRHDSGNWIYQAGFTNYHSKDMRYQNCIVIDSDQNNYYINENDQTNRPGEHTFWAFLFANSGNYPNINFEGSIALNGNMIVGSVSGGYVGKFINVVGWDIDGNLMMNNHEGDMTINHCTLGRGTGQGFGSYCGANANIINSILYGFQESALYNSYGGISHSYLSFYGNKQNFFKLGSSPATSTDFCSENNNAIDPLTGNPGNGISALKYLPRIEEGSDLKGAASDGGDIGANILYKIGRDGTLWGEEGYDEVTNEPLWPWPNEDIIKTQMQAYYYDDPNDNLLPLRGNRGFCATGTALYGGPITLTSYIWEYLGNPCPSDICNYNDHTAPQAVADLLVSDVSQTEATISWTAPGDDGQNGQAAGYDLRYSLSPLSESNWGQAQEVNNELSPGQSGQSQSIIVSNLSPQTTYYFGLKTRDDANNWSDLSNIISFTTLANNNGGGGGGGSGNGGGSGSNVSTDTQPPKTPDNFQAKIISYNNANNNQQIQLTWTNPSDNDFVKVIVIRKINSEPKNSQDGEIIYEGNKQAYLDIINNNQNNNNLIYYYAILAFDQHSNCSSLVTTSLFFQNSQNNQNLTTTNNSNNNSNYSNITNLYGLKAEIVNNLSFKEAKIINSHSQFVPLTNIEKIIFAKITQKHLEDYQKLNQNNKYSLALFIHQGGQVTKRLGAGERAGVIDSFYTAFHKLPQTQTDWQDIIKIANGRWPSQTNKNRENQIKNNLFKQIYLKEPDPKNQFDQAAITIIAYGLRPAKRNLNSERAGLRIFKAIFRHNPASAQDWDIVRAIAYSGSTR